MTPVLAVSDLRKSYGRTEALRGVSLDVGVGELFGLLGPNRPTSSPSPTSTLTPLRAWIGP